MVGFNERRPKRTTIEMLKLEMPWQLQFRTSPKGVCERGGLILGRELAGAVLRVDSGGGSLEVSATVVTLPARSFDDLLRDEMVQMAATGGRVRVQGMAFERTDDSAASQKRTKRRKI
jgi:hypothetical protein